MASSFLRPYIVQVPEIWGSRWGINTTSVQHHDVWLRSKNTALASPWPASAVCPVSNLPQIETPLRFQGRPECAEVWRVNNPIDHTKLIPIIRKETEEHSSSLKFLGHRVQCWLNLWLRIQLRVYKEPGKVPLLSSLIRCCPDYFIMLPVFSHKLVLCWSQ